MPTVDGGDDTDTIKGVVESFLKSALQNPSPRMRKVLDEAIEASSVMKEMRKRLDDLENVVIEHSNLTSGEQILDRIDNLESVVRSWTMPSSTSNTTIHVGTIMNMNFGPGTTLSQSNTFDQSHGATFNGVSGVSGVSVSSSSVAAPPEADEAEEEDEEEEAEEEDEEEEEEGDADDRDCKKRARINY